MPLSTVRAGELPQPTDHVFPGNHIKRFNSVLDRCQLKLDRDGDRRTAYSLQRTYAPPPGQVVRLISIRYVESMSTNRLTKLDVARHQLGTALDLFIRDRDPIAVQCLACGGGELIEQIATINNVQPFSTHILETVPDIDIRRIRFLQRQYWNAFKHLNDREGERRDDDATLAAFGDETNDAALFIGWHDYSAVTGRLPLPAQVFLMWYYALNEEKLAPGSDLDVIRKLFPAIMTADRTEQKRRLRRAVEKYRDDAKTLADPATEKEPLCFPASVFKTKKPPPPLMPNQSD
jgi:hypothetical protein